MFRVSYGTYANKNLNWDGSSWVQSQYKSGINQPPLFQLYDLNGVSLDDSGTYPNSNFTGSKLFNYKTDVTNTHVSDAILGFPILHDNNGQILFENYLATESVCPLNQFPTESGNPLI